MRYIKNASIKIKDEKHLRERLIEVMAGRPDSFYKASRFSKPTVYDTTTSLLDNYFQDLCCAVVNYEIGFYEGKDVNLGEKVEPFIGSVEGFIEWYDDSYGPHNTVYRDVYGIRDDGKGWYQREYY